MSGIYIPGMEMPKNCFDCPLFDDVYTDADGDDDYSCGLGVPLDYYQASGETKKDCPLIPVPPHGDLIDRDALLASDPDLHAVKENEFGTEYMIDIYSGANKSGYSACMIEEAPTIIPAEPAEAGET